MKLKWIGFFILSAILGIFLHPLNLHPLHLNFLSLLIGMFLIFLYFIVFDIIAERRK
jgi:hypothetical protein